ncbi:hypothetical protein AB0G00_13020 [Nocardia salmonicida]|nr:hypothetical protein [Nocardia sp. PE-7]WKG13066.1 hypothetical protein QX204_16970 [Nocardia sp. PE-7]
MRTASQLFVFSISATVLAVVGAPAIYWIIWGGLAVVAVVLWFVRR